ncbi:outer membrane usher protein [Salmonella enterica]|nr:outer membrane usher protein [Salmonella enterica]EAT5121909.1 outer membrane usher protein [Salmonella enterica]
MLFQRSLLCLTIGAALPFSVSAATSAAEKTVAESDEAVEFNEQFLLNSSANIDISRYAYGNPVLAGTYRVKVNLNNALKSTSEITFNENGTPRASACLTPLLLTQAGVDPAAMRDDVEVDDNTTCLDIKKYYPGATANYDSGKQAMDLNFPQIYILKRPAGYVDPSLWEDGVPAAIVSYDMNAWHSEGNGTTSDTAYVGLRYGLNMGPWRLRSRGSLNWNKDTGSEYNNQDVYLQRDITALKAQMVIGDSYTRGDAFDSFSLSGIRMYNDDRMLPMGSSNYAPVIRGVANSNAKVTVMQSGNKIYETTVPPGAFEINDLSTTGYGNDLLVTVEEADGSKRSFTVPFSSVTQMLRPGATRWDIGVGELNDDSLHDKPQVGYAQFYYGLNNTFTGYIGAQYTDMNFYAGLLGLAMNTGIGAFAFDVTQSHASIDDLGTLSGQSYRLTYSKMIEATNTSFNVAAYRFSTEDYLSLNDAASLQDSVKHQQYAQQSYRSGDELYDDYQRTKNQVQISINQPLNQGETTWGSVYVSGTWQDYWNDAGSTANYSVGYNNSFAYGSYSVSLQRAYDQNGSKDDSVYLSFSIPLSMFSHNGERSGGFSNINMGLRSDMKGGTNVNSTASGNTKDSDISYSVSATSSSGNYGNLNQVSGFGSLNSSYGPLGISASFGDDNSQQYSASYSGGMVLHSGGVAFAPGSIGETDAVALVKASGAVVLVNFETDEGRSLILELLRSDKGFIPLGADVLNEKNETVGTVGQAGQAYVRGVEQQGELRVVWGSGKESTCTVRYQLAETTAKAGLTPVLSNQLCHM